MNTGELVSVLNESESITEIKEIQLINDEQTLAIRHDQGIHLQNFARTISTIRFYSGDHGISQFLVSQDRNELILLSHPRRIVKIDLCKRSRQTWSIPEREDLEIKLIGANMALLKYKTRGDDSNSRNQGQTYTIEFFDLEKNREDSGSTGQSSGEASTTSGDNVKVDFDEEITCFEFLWKNDPNQNSQDDTRPHSNSNSFNSEKICGSLLVGSKTGKSYLTNFAGESKIKKKQSFPKKLKKFDLFESLNDTKSILNNDRQTAPNSSMTSMKNNQVNNNFTFKKKYVYDIKRFYTNASESDKSIEMIDLVISASEIEGEFEFQWGRINDKFTSKIIKLFDNKKNNSSNVFIHQMGYFEGKWWFYITHELGFNVFELEKSPKSKGHYLYSDPGENKVQYSQKLGLFFITENNSIKIIDKICGIIVNILQFESEVLGLQLVESLSKSILLVHEQSRYHEIDLENHGSLRQVEMENNPPGPRVTVALNLNLLPTEQSIKMPSFCGGVCRLNLVSDRDDLDIRNFPFNGLVQSFSKENCEKGIEQVAQFYLSQMEKLDHVDSIYGPMSPLFLAIYREKDDLLKKLLSKNLYPREVHGYITPLSFAFQKQQKNAVKILCEHLSSSKLKIKLSRMDLQNLILSDEKHCHDLISKGCQSMKQSQFPLNLYVKKGTEIMTFNSCNDLLRMIKNRDEKRKKAKKKLPLEKMTVYELPVNYSTRAPEIGNLILLDSILKSKSPKFVKGPFSCLVNEEWSRLYCFIFFKAILFWAFFFVHVFPIFILDQTFLKELFMFLKALCLAIWTFLSLIQLFSYCRFKFSA